MSSKEQYKDALEADKRIIAELVKIIDARDKQISTLQDNCKFWRVCYVEASNKKWWQFWK